MAFSPVHQIEIDSTYRLASSKSSTDFEYELPFTWPTLGPSQIRLTNMMVPNTFFNLPTATINDGINTATENLDLGNYSFTEAAARMTSVMQKAVVDGGLNRVNGSLNWDSSLKRYYFIDTSGFFLPYTMGGAWLPILGFNSTQAIGLANVRYYAASSPSLNEQNLNFYVRLSTFENKIILPNAYNSFVSFCFPLRNMEPQKEIWYLPNNTSTQKILVSSPYHNTNKILKIQLLRRDGTIVDLNERNWMMSLRIEPLGYMDD